MPLDNNNSDVCDFCKNDEGREMAAEQNIEDSFNEFN